MRSEQKIRARVAEELASLLKDEKAHVAKYRRTRNFILPWNWTAAAAASMALAGGFLCGLTVAFDNSAQSWPIVKPLLKDNALDLLKGEKP